MPSQQDQILVSALSSFSTSTNGFELHLLGGCTERSITTCNAVAHTPFLSYSVNELRQTTSSSWSKIAWYSLVHLHSHLWYEWGLSEPRCSLSCDINASSCAGEELSIPFMGTSIVWCSRTPYMTMLCLTNTGVCMQLDSRLYNDHEFNMLCERQRNRVTCIHALE